MELRRGLPAVIAFVMLPSLFACSDDTDPNAGGGSPSVTPAVSVPADPSGESCPVEANACRAAVELSAEVKQGSPGFVERFVLSEFECPGADSADHGLGAPFPLCDGAQPGDRRSGFRWSASSHPITYSTDQLDDQVLSLLSDTATVAFDWEIQTIACPMSPDSCDSGFMVAFGKVSVDEEMLRSDALLFQIGWDSSGRWTVTSAFTPILFPHLQFVLDGGAQGTNEPIQVYTEKFRTFYQWKP